MDISSGSGRLLTYDKFEKIYKKGLDYDLQVDDNLFFAATNKRELEDACFINHSCNPNCGIKDKLKVVAMRKIKKGEEITFDYAMSETSDYKMKCNCKQKNCREIITGEDWKLEKLQKNTKDISQTTYRKE